MENSTTMKTKALYIVVVVTLTVASISAQAQVAITGAINFTGGATTDTPIPNATTFETFVGPSGSGGPVVLAVNGFPDGSYAGAAGNTVAEFNAPFDFATYYAAFEASTTLPSFDLFSFTSGGQTYSFQINTVDFEAQIAIPDAVPPNYIGLDYIGIYGWGTGTITGDSTTYLPTVEQWAIVEGFLTGTSVNDYTFDITIGNTDVPVPEPSTLAFAGLGSLLSIVTLIRRK